MSFAKKSWFDSSTFFVLVHLTYGFLYLLQLWIGGKPVTDPEGIVVVNMIVAMHSSSMEHKCLLEMSFRKL